jgi:hypothetical protein
MSGSWKHASPMVRPLSSRWAPALLCVLVLVLTAIVVYRWGSEYWTPTSHQPTYTATAYVAERSQTRESRIPVVSSADDPQRAEETANALADRYVRKRREDWSRRTDGPCLNARAAAESARRELAKNESQLAAFRRQMTEAAEAATKKPETPLPPSMVDNPEWVELDGRLQKLQRRHDGLLVDRTPLHPAVQDVAVQIDDLKQQMATIPRQVPGEKAQTPEGPELQPAENPALAASDLVSKADQEKLDELTAAVEAGRRTCVEAEAAEKQALAQQQAGPQYSIEDAQVVEVPPPPDYGWWRLLATTLVAGVLMASGVGSMTAAAGIDPPAGSIAQVQSAAGAPVVGVIPAEDPIPDPSKLSRRRSRLRKALAAIGLLLMAACPLAAFWGVLGI